MSFKATQLIERVLDGEDAKDVVLEASVDPSELPQGANPNHFIWRELLKDRNEYGRFSFDRKKVKSLKNPARIEKLAEKYEELAHKGSLAMERVYGYERRWNAIVEKLKKIGIEPTSNWGDFLA